MGGKAERGGRRRRPDGTARRWRRISKGVRRRRRRRRREGKRRGRSGAWRLGEIRRKEADRCAESSSITSKRSSVVGISNLRTMLSKRNRNSSNKRGKYAQHSAWRLLCYILVVAAWFSSTCSSHSSSSGGGGGRWRGGVCDIWGIWGRSRGLAQQERPRRSGGCRTGAVCLIPPKNMGEPVGLQAGKPSGGQAGRNRLRR